MAWRVSQTARRMTFTRDNFTCCACGWRPTRTIPAPYDGRSTLREVVAFRWRRFGPYASSVLVRDPVYRWLEVDHVKPRASGIDPYDPSNWQTLCNRCNAKKGARV